MMKPYLLMLIPLTLMILSMFTMLIPMKKNKFHPLNLNIMLIFLIMFIIMYMNILMKSWLTYTLFLTIIGGLMIIFMYITSLSNNEISSLNLINILMPFIKMMIIIIFIIFFLKMMFNSNLFWNNLELTKMNYSNEKNYNMNFNFIYNEKKYINIFFMNYLFYSMICIMNICYKFNMPLRKMIHYE